MNVKYCAQCGTQMNLDAAFCPNCGFQQRPMPSNKPRQNDPVPADPAPVNPVPDAPVTPDAPVMPDAPVTPNVPVMPGNPAEAAPRYAEGEKKGLGRLILSVLVTILMIAGGFSGDLVLRGTESSTALIVVGFGFLVFDIIQFIAYAKAKPPVVYAPDNATVVLRAAVSDVAKQRAKAENINVNTYVFRALASVPAVQKMEGLGVASYLVGSACLEFVSGSRWYLETEFLPYLNVQGVSSAYGVYIVVEPISTHHPEYTVLGEIRCGQLEGGGFIVDGVNAGLRR